MSKRRGQQTANLTVNLWPDQKAAADQALEIAVRVRGHESKNDALAFMLQRLCIQYGIEWPEHEKQQGKRTDLENS